MEAKNGTRVKLWADVDAETPVAEGGTLKVEPNALVCRGDRGDKEYRVMPIFPARAIEIQHLKLWSVDEGSASVLTSMVYSLQPELVVEVGTNWGRSTRALAEGLSMNGKGHLWTVDMIDYDIHNSGALLEDQKDYVTQIVGSTPDVYTNDETLRDMKGIELAFLDGEHTAEGVEQDLEYVDAHRAMECLVIVDNARDDQWDTEAEFFNTYDKYPHINIPTMCGFELIWMADKSVQQRKGVWNGNSCA
tara:strand:+ start:341 stop:1084 length:744 start_codon:yes stop_codon:yes gene_type:complete